MDIPVITKPVLHGLHTSISCLIWGTLLDIHRGRWTALLFRENGPFSVLYPVHQTGCSLGNRHTDIGDCFIVTCGSCVNPNMLFPKTKDKDTVSKLVTLIIHFGKGFLGSWWNWSTKWDIFFTLHFLVSVVSWFFPLSMLTTCISNQRS